MLLSKEIFLEKAIDVGGSCVCILGITFIILNTFFPIFPNVALANWCAGLAIGIFYCVTTICSNIAEYHNDNYPCSYKIWVLFYPVLFIGTILVLLYGNFVLHPTKELNWFAGSFLAFVLCIEIYLDDKYDFLDDDSVESDHDCAEADKCTESEDELW